MRGRYFLISWVVVLQLFLVFNNAYAIEPPECGRWEVVKVEPIFMTYGNVVHETVDFRMADYVHPQDKEMKCRRFFFDDGKTVWQTWGKLGDTYTALFLEDGTFYSVKWGRIMRLLEKVVLKVYRDEGRFIYRIALFDNTVVVKERQLLLKVKFPTQDQNY